MAQGLEVRVEALWSKDLVKSHTDTQNAYHILQNWSGEKTGGVFRSQSRFGVLISR